MAFPAMAVLVVVIGVTTNPVVLAAAMLALFGVVLLLGLPVPTGDRGRHCGAGAAVPGGGRPAAAAGDGRPPGGDR